MNKEKIIEEISKLGLNKDNFWVIGSSSLVLRGILDTANDIDLAMTNDEFLKIKERIDLIYLGEKYNVKWYKINNIIEFCIDQIDDGKVDSCNTFNLLNLKYYYDNFLKNSNREKDKEKKQKIRNYLCNINSKNKD